MLDGMLTGIPSLSGVGKPFQVCFVCAQGKSRESGLEELCAPPVQQPRTSGLPRSVIVFSFAHR